MTTPSQTSVLFLDQTGQLGGAELCLADFVSTRAHGGDRVIVFQEGPFPERLRAMGVDVEVLALGRVAAGVRKSSGWLRQLRSAVAIARLSRDVATRARPCDLIYANTAKALVVGVLAGWLSRKPVVFHLHDIVSADHFSASNRRLLVRLVNRGTRAVIANSHATRDAFFAAGGNRPITVVANGIDPTPFDRAVLAAETHRRQWRMRLAVDDAPVLALFGRIAAWKGQTMAIEAMTRLPTMHLWIVGAALFDEADEELKLRESVRRLGMEERVHFLGFQNAVAEIMVASDVVIHCSTSPEPFGRVIVEAMLARRPIVASRAGGAAEIIEAGRTGWLFEPSSVDDLVRCVGQAMADPVSTAGIVAAGASEARKRFDLLARATDINRVIRHVSHPSAA